MKLIKNLQRSIDEIEDMDPTAIVIVPNSEGKLLILQRGHTAPWHPGEWSIPGGTIEMNETPQQAAIRETYEETDLRIKKIVSLPKYKLGFPDFTSIYPFVALSYTGKVFLKETLLSSGIHVMENIEYKWIDLRDIDDYQFVPSVKKLLVRYLCGE